MAYPSYDEYKRTRWDEVGTIPSKWEARRLKFAVLLCNEKIEADTTDLEYIGLENIESWTGKRIEDESSYSEGIATRFKPNDILFGKLRPYLAKVYLAEKAGMATTEALVLQSERDILPVFLKYLMLSHKFIDNVSGTTYGAKMPRANWDSIGNFPILLPDRIEQQRITDFLDWKTGQIDRLIAKKKQLIEKLKEKRIALITQAVTKGLNPDAPMRDSGIPWLGEVPKHWEVLSIKRLTPVSRGASPRPIEDQKYFDDEGEYAWVRIADVTSNDHYLRETTQRLSELGKSLSVPLEPGSLFLSIAGSVGKPMITAIKACIHDGFVYFPQLQINPEYLFYIFESGQPYLGLGKLGTQLNLNTDTVGNIKIGLPENDEQQEIVDFLDLELSHLDVLIAKNNQLIEKLTEYRTALITAATTGKIDVRNVKIGGLL